LAKLKALTGAEDGDAVFFVADKPETGVEICRPGAHKVGLEMGLIAETSSASAGSSISRCSSMTRRP